MNHNPYAVSCAGAALDECHRWLNAELTAATAQEAEGNRRLIVNTDPLINPNYVNHEALLHHYAREVQMQLARLRCATTHEAIAAWKRVCRHNGRDGAEELVRDAVAATAKVYPRARRVLDTKSN